MATQSFNHRESRHRGVAKIALIVIVVLVIVPAGGLFAYSFFGNNGEGGEQDNSPASSVTREWFNVERRSFDLTVTAMGNLQASEQVEIRCAVEGKENTIVEIVPEGTRVNAGDVLLRIASDVIQESIENEQLAVAEARSEKTAADKALAIAETIAMSEKKAAGVNLDLARLELEQWRQGDLVKKRQELDLGLEKAKRNLDRADKDYKNSKTLFADKFISENDLIDDELAYIEAEAALETAKLSQEVFESFEYPKLLKQFTSDVDQAETALETTVAENDRKLEQAQSEVVEETRSLQLREQRLASLLRQFEACTILAPKDGMVVYASSLGGRDWRDDSALGQGSSVYYNQLVMVLPDTTKMVASILVHEAMVPMVQPGQPVSVRIDAMADRPLTGKVKSVGVMAEDGGWWNRDLRQYRVLVDLDEAGARGVLKPSMRCLGVIRVGRIENALAVPIQAVHAEGRTKFVYVPSSGGQVEQRAVRIGRSSETLVEITEGLTDGDRVLLRAPKPGELAKSDKPLRALDADPDERGPRSGAETPGAGAPDAGRRGPATQGGQGGGERSGGQRPNAGQQPGNGKPGSGSDGQRQPQTGSTSQKPARQATPAANEESSPASDGAESTTADADSAEQPAPTP